VRGIQRVRDQLGDGRVEGQTDMADRIGRADILDELVRDTRVAIRLVGGLFDLISDWFLDADPTEPDQKETLIDDMITYYIVVRRGLTT
jgi:hypothetical protein